MFTTLSPGAWTECDQGVLLGGDVGGDAQLSESSERRFARSLDHGSELCLLSFRAYWAVGDDRPEVEARTVQITIQVEHLHCTDLNDPGGTETFSEYLYWDQHEGLSGLDADAGGPRHRIESLSREDLAEAEAQIHCTAGSSTPPF